MRRIVWAQLCALLCIVLPDFSAGQPIANFTSNTVSGCSPIVVHFTDQSTGNPTSWSWDLGNSTTSTLQNPSTTYINPGTYTVKLIATNTGGSNTKTTTAYITVYATPTVAFTADSSVSCAPKTIVFANQSSAGNGGTANYLWDFGDGNTSSLVNPTHIYTSTGNFSVTLVVTNNNSCNKPLTKTNYIQLIPKPTANFTSPNATGCSTPYAVSFSNTSTGAVSYNWDFGDGGTSTSASPAHTYNATGTYTVRLIATNASGCSDTVTKSNFVSVLHVVSLFSKSTGNACKGSTVTFTNLSNPSIASTAWSFGDGGTSTVANPSYAYSNAGPFTIRLIATNGTCSDTSLQLINVLPKATAAFNSPNPNSCGAPYTVNFNNNSINAASYLWIFGDGNTSAQTAPGHTYATNGIYTVSMVAINSNGCSDTMKIDQLVKIQPPTASITDTFSGCAPINITFHSNFSSLLLVTNYIWNFGDGSSPLTCGSCASPIHTYAAAGTYTITLNYSTGSGCNFSTQTSITIGAKPSASFTLSPASVCPGQTVFGANASTGATNYYWSDNISAILTTVNSSWTYGPGVYRITLHAINNGCEDTISHYFTVNLPRASFTPTYQCSNRLAIQFADHSVGADSYLWDFGDGNSSTQAGTTSHTYASYGTYVARLTVINNSTGCSDTYIYTIVVGPLVAQFAANITAICKGNSIFFTASLSQAISQYLWNFGDGDTAMRAENVVSHSYVNPGIYTVKLIIRDTGSCKDSIVKTNYIQVGGVTANFSGSPLSGCPGLPVTFTDLSTSGVAIANRRWDFGDGATNSLAASTTGHTYITAGNYNVTLTVTDADNCTSTLTKASYIATSKPIPQFAASVTSACEGQQISFNNSSAGASPNYNWDFGDGNHSTSVSPNHSYSQTGNYSVKLVATDVAGCKDSVTIPAYIHIQGPTAGFTMSDSTASCPPLAVLFTNTTTASQSYNWTFGNSSSSSLTNPATVYTYPGIYQVKLKTHDALGCQDSAIKTVHVYGPTGNFSFTPAVGCSPLTVSFSATTQNTALLVWDMNNGVTQSTTSNSFSYTYTQTGKYVPKLILSDNASCLVPVISPDTIKVDHMDAEFSFLPASLCNSGTVQFNDTTLTSLTNVTDRNWVFGDGGTSTAHNPSHPYAAPGIYTVRLIIGNSDGCQDTVIHTVTIYALPTLTVSPNQSMCQGNTIPVNLAAGGASTYTWSPATGLSCTACSNPTTLPASTTTYTVTGTDIHGCINTAQVTVTVNPKPTISGGNNQAICAGSSTTLNATGGSTYTWSPATGLSCTGCSVPVATPSNTTLYKVIGTNSFGCTDSANVTVTVNPLPVITATGSKTLCKGDTSQLQASGGISYSWSPAAGLTCANCTNPIASPLTTTTYTVAGTGNNGCISTAQVTVTVNPLPTVSAGNNITICTGSSTTLAATGGLNYVWTPSLGLSCNNCASPVANPSATTTYSLKGTDGNGCVNNASVTVTVNPIPAVTTNGDKTICQGDVAKLQANGAGSYSWFPSFGLSCNNCANPNASPATTTIYNVSGTTNGCSDTVQVTVNILPLPPVNAGPDIILCTGKAVNLHVTGAAGYQWSPATGLSCTNCANPAANPSGTITYTIVGTGANGCVAADTLAVTLHDKPLIDAGAAQTICSGTDAQLQASGANQYSWAPVSYLSCVNCSNPVANPPVTITYTVTGTDAYGCSNIDSVVINIIEKNPITVSKSDSVCKGVPVHLHATGGDVYIWIPVEGLDNAQIADPIATPDDTRTYKVVVKQGACFEDTGYVTIIVHPLPVADAGDDKHITAGTSVQLSVASQPDVKYQWSQEEDLSCNDCPGPIATPKRTTKYTVSLTNIWNCTASDDVTVFVTCDGQQLFVANTFTPNGDGVNDRFFPQGKGVSTVALFNIYNRWGQLVFSANNIPLNDELSGWDGMYNGEQLKPDVFVYIIHATCSTGEPIEMKGDISLIR